MKIISRRQMVETKETFHSFKWVDNPNAGFGFDLGEDGKVKEDICEAGAINYYLCLTGQLEVTDEGLVTYTNRYCQPAVGECSCGETVSLGHFTNTCSCGRDYNSSGQLLAPRDQWGEDTGETLEEILSIE